VVVFGARIQYQRTMLYYSENICVGVLFSLVRSKMKYRIWSDGKKFKIQRKKFLIWRWLNVCGVFCWYGKESPKIFCTRSEAIDYIKDRIENTLWEHVEEIRLRR